MCSSGGSVVFCVCVARFGMTFESSFRTGCSLCVPLLLRSVSRTGLTWPVPSPGDNRGIEWALNCLWALIKRRLPSLLFRQRTDLASYVLVKYEFIQRGTACPHSPRFWTERWGGFQSVLAWHWPTDGAAWHKANSREASVEEND